MQYNSSFSAKAATFGVLLGSTKVSRCISRSARNLINYQNSSIRAGASAFAGLGAYQPGLQPLAPEVHASEQRLQALSDAVKRACHGAASGREIGDLTEVIAALDRITLEDLNLQAPPQAQLGITTRFTSQEAEFIPIQTTPDYVIGVFKLKAGAFLPLHDHMGMTVLSKAIYGSVRIPSYDWVDPQVYQRQKQDGDKFTAVKIGDSVLRGPASPTVVLRPERGNIHSFLGLSDCAVLDILTPPYKPESGRKLNYYREVGSGLAQSNDNKSGSAPFWPSFWPWLQSPVGRHKKQTLEVYTPDPTQRFTRRVPYTGTPIINP